MEPTADYPVLDKKNKESKGRKRGGGSRNRYSAQQFWGGAAWEKKPLVNEIKRKRKETTGKPSRSNGKTGLPLYTLGGEAKKQSSIQSRGDAGGEAKEKKLKKHRKNKYRKSE